VASPRPNELWHTGMLRRVLAQVEVSDSNPMVEDVRYMRIARYRNRGGITRSCVNPARCVCVGYAVGGPDSEQG